MGLKVYAEFERLTTGVEDWATFVNKVYEAYDSYVKQAVYDAMVDYSNNMVAPYAKTGTLDAESLRDLCDTIEMLTGQSVIIMGTRTALRKVMGLQNAQYISDSMKNEHYTTGMLGMWEGRELVELQQGLKHNDLTQKLITNDILWIMPVTTDRFIKFVNEGDTQVYSVTDPATHMDMTYDFEFQKKIGIAVMFGVAFGTYTAIA